MSNKLSFADFRIAIERVLKHAEFCGIDFVDVSKADYYWKISETDRFNFTKEPIVSVGSLHDELSAVLEVVADSDSVVSAVDIQNVGSLLQYIACEIAPIRQPKAKDI